MAALPGVQPVDSTCNITPHATRVLLPQPTFRDSILSSFANHMKLRTHSDAYTPTPAHAHACDCQYVRTCMRMQPFPLSPGHSGRLKGVPQGITTNLQ